MSTDPEPQLPDQTAAADPSMFKLLDEITFQYVKNSLCRVIHVDGVWGGITPQGNIHMSFFSEQATTPNTIKYEQSEQGILKELSREVAIGGNAFTREIDVQAVVSLSTARAIVVWLNTRIAILEQSEQEKQRQSESED